ncbi:hypothetical protein ATG_15820 [Desulfurococcaceae archaeon AG1]|jgi:SAM-dependent methyltransferase|nr:hypothetical protein ATG_15820 [Desulfurococcaceae archaeon AG1]
MSGGEYMERLYRLIPWVEDPFTAEGFKRYRDTISEFSVIVKHRWFSELVNRRRELRIIDLCSGTGIGGVALARVLMDLGVSVSLTLVDLRRDALDKAVEFGLRELGFRPQIMVRDILEEGLGLETGFDVSLIWGFTTPHFGPWDWVRVLSNVSRLLTGDGLFLYNESDRVYTIFYLKGYRDLLPEVVERDRVILTIHKGKDFRSGYIKRLVLNLVSREAEETKVYFWDLASSAAFTWIFFSDVDFIPTRGSHSGVVIARSPRRTLSLEALFREKPSILMHERL